MAQVNYVREMERFSDYAEANRVTASERLVWLGLFHLFNARAFASEWPDGYIEIRRADLISAAGVSKNTVLRARESLAKRGLIDYTIGGGDGGSRYKLVYLSVYGAPEGSREETVAADCRRYGKDGAKDGETSSDRFAATFSMGEGFRGAADPSHDGTTLKDIDPSHDGTTPSQCGTTPSHDGTTPSHDGTTKTGDVVTTKYKPSVNVNLNIEDEDIYNNKLYSAGARVGESGSGDEGKGNGGGRLPPLRNDGERPMQGDEETPLERAFAQLIGRRASPVEISEIAEIAAWCGAGDDLVCEAIRRAGSAGAKSAGKYVTTCLMKWSDWGIRALDELETWERLDELSRSVRPDIAEKGRQRLGAFLRELKLKHRTVNAV